MRFFRAFSSVVRQMPGCNFQRRGTVRISQFFIVMYVPFCVFCLSPCVFVFIVFNVSLSQRSFLDLGILLFLFLKNSDSLGNYGPIKILDTFSKIHKYLSINSFRKFNSCQLGFMKYKPTATKLVVLPEFITRLVYSKPQSDAIF
jgi:hypothetical protein